jgi:hypothetical protein
MLQIQRLRWTLASFRAILILLRFDGYLGRRIAVQGTFPGYVAMSKELTIRVRTRNDLADLAGRHESPAWVVGRGREERLANVQIVNFAGDRMIVAGYDPVKSERRGDGRLIIRFKEPRIVSCDVAYDGQNPVRYV